MNPLNPTPAERSMITHVDQLGTRMADVFKDETNPRIVAVVMFSFLQNNPELSAAFESLCGDWILPLTLRNTRSIFEGDKALNAALRRIR